MEIDKICFAGEGHGGVVALKSLQQNFKQIEVISKDEEIIELLRIEDCIVKSIENSSATLIVCAGYKSIISKNTLKKKTIINTHPSLLPKYRGLHGLVWAMLNFEKELGFSIHLMNEKIDDGDIIEQYKITYNGETSKEIMDKFDIYIENNLGRVVKQFINKEITPIKQNINRATWTPRRNIDDCIIDFNWNKKFIDIFFKALVRPYPLPILKVKDRLYEINGYKFIEINYYTQKGRVVNIDNDDVYIKTKDGLLLVNRLIDFDTKKTYKANNILKLGMRL